MSFQGRSPLKDVTRSVVMGAAMIPATVLAGCSRHANATNPPPTMTPGDAGLVTPPVVLAPPPDVVRPRTPPVGTGNGMPTRGFSGGRRRT